MDQEALKVLVDRVAPPPKEIVLDAEHRVLMLPQGWQVHDVSRYLPPPGRIQQEVDLLTLDAFTGYVAQFKTGNSTIFADESAGEYDAVIDYHVAAPAEGGNPRGNCEHVASYTCPQSDQWNLWNGNDRKSMTQVEFARFLEDNLPDVVSPPSADLLRLVLQLQIHKSADFVSDTRLQDGQTKLRYEETIRNESKQGDLQFPDSFVIGVPVFVDGKRYAVKARLRYRLEESKLSLWYELERPLDVFRTAVKEVSEQIRKALPDVAFWAGKRS